MILLNFEAGNAIDAFLTKSRVGDCDENPIIVIGYSEQRSDTSFGTLETMMGLRHTINSQGPWQEIIESTDG